MSGLGRGSWKRGRPDVPRRRTSSSVGTLAPPPWPVGEEPREHDPAEAPGAPGVADGRRRRTPFIGLRPLLPQLGLVPRVGGAEPLAPRSKPRTESLGASDFLWVSRDSWSFPRLPPCWERDPTPSSPDLNLRLPPPFSEVSPPPPSPSSASSLGPRVHSKPVGLYLVLGRSV